mmetsp:Transcript_26962/g.48741  ORF Transcript_26962/g.48741 Transcript_26962/m.48741 type:complete len:84 (+) Transcript_26962:1057-1308(+)
MRLETKHNDRGFFIVGSLGLVQVDKSTSGRSILEVMLRQGCAWVDGKFHSGYSMETAQEDRKSNGSAVEALPLHLWGPRVLSP